jgi:ABC-type Fe3+/spermidine/putrescine transport system ATPase subunit
VTHFLEVDGLSKSFDAEVAVDGISFGVEPGQILTLLGPSGCGKTTTLRCIAGLETPDAGTIRIQGDAVSSVAEGRLVPAERRNIGMVFQSYAVWPHMTVGQNLDLPLQVRHVAPAERRQRVQQVLELVGLTGLEDRYATRLSGGQQQRVALARALIYNPRLLLFDEPLSNLDAKLRERMRHEIRRLQREVGITSVYVTHDQAEAMIISDRIIVMNRGRIEQEGDARTLYTQPASAFVATFLGVANLVRGQVVAQGCVQIDGALLRARGEVTSGEVYVSIRPEDIALQRGPAENALCGTVETVNYLGNFVEYLVRAAGHEWRVQSDPHQSFAPGDEVSLVLPPERCLCLPG